MSREVRGSGARERLLVTLLEVFDEGLPDPSVSLREVAARAGTSHALLRYHFGSLPGVLAAMLSAQRERNNRTLTVAAQDSTFGGLVMAIWEYYSRPEHRSRIRGFFHVAGLAAYEPEGFREFTATLDDLTRLLASLAEREGQSPEEALATATTAIAALRGLLLQQLLHPVPHALAAVRIVAGLGTR